MKSILFVFILFSSFCFSQSSENNRTGNITKVDGYYVYMFSDPTDEYETLGFIKEAKIVWSGKPKEMYNLMFKKIRSQYPNCDAVIVESIDFNRVRAIKFK